MGVGMEKTSESLEDYLEVIFRLKQNQETIRVSDIAEARGVSMASVCQALQRLDKSGYVKYSARETIELTTEGWKLAQKINSRHRFLFRFLHDILGVDKDSAEIDACSMEHILSTNSISHLVAFLQFIESTRFRHKSIAEMFRECEPTGCALPSLHRHGPGRGRRIKGSRFFEGPFLHSLKPGEKARVVHLHAGCAIRQRLIDMGILPGVEVEMIRKAPLGDPIEVRLRGFSLSLRNSEAKTIEIEKYVGK